jgi:hypothetical protein
VLLAGRALQTVASDDGSVRAQLPPGTKPGRYTVEVRRVDGTSTTAQVTVRPRSAKAGTGTAAAPTGPPVLESATAESDMAAVTIRVRNLGSDMPSVTVGGKAVSPLTFDGTTLVARLPARSAPGKYTVVVTRSDGAAASLQAVLGR